MREQSERGMEKVREFIAKEKTRNEATTRKLINEHEKILSNHKKELNKIVYSINRFKDMVTEVLNGKDITQIVVQTNFKYGQSPLQLRISSSELLSSLEFEVYQTIKEKDMKIRDLSGRKRLDDKELDKRIKEREKTVFSMLDFTNEKLRKEKERVLKREQWVNRRIKTELDFEKQQESEVRTIEKALVRFWGRQSGDQDAIQLSSPRPPPPDSTPDGSAVTVKEPTPVETNNNKTPANDFGFDAMIPKLFISVPDQRKNVGLLDVAHRAGQLSNLGHKIIVRAGNSFVGGGAGEVLRNNEEQYCARWLEIAEQKITAIFKAYVKYRRLCAIQVEMMEQNDDIDRAMILHRRIRDLLDLQYKKLHVDLGKLATYSAGMLEEEEDFFCSLPDPRALKNIVRPAMLHINHNAKRPKRQMQHRYMLPKPHTDVVETTQQFDHRIAVSQLLIPFHTAMLKKIMDSVGPKKQEGSILFPHVTCSTEGLPSTIEEIAVTKPVAKAPESGTWPNRHTTKQDEVAAPLLIPRLLQLDTDRLNPVRLQKAPTQNRNTVKSSLNLHTGLPPIPHFSPIKAATGIHYVPNICSVWDYREGSCRRNVYISLSLTLSISLSRSLSLYLTLSISLSLSQVSLTLSLAHSENRILLYYVQEQLKSLNAHMD
eukprot:sb/3462821/